MPAYDLEEQEQLSAIKAWWERYGKFISNVALVLAIAALAWFGWQRYQRSQAEAATGLYTEAFRAAQAGDATKLQQTASQLTKDYPKTLQASLATLLAAKSDIDKNDAKNARIKLEWITEHSADALVKDMARLRLASLMLDGKEYDAALKQVDSAASPEFAARFAELRGDVLLEQGKPEDARSAYKQAAEKYGVSSEGATLKNIVETKLEALGGN